METYGIEKYGITGTTEIVYNPSYEMLYEEETKPGLTGYEVGKPTAREVMLKATQVSEFRPSSL